MKNKRRRNASAIKNYDNRNLRRFIRVHEPLDLTIGSPFRKRPERQKNSIIKVSRLSPRPVDKPSRVNLPDNPTKNLAEGKKPVKRQSNLSLREDPKDRKNTCKQRPTKETKRSGSGLSRRFIPWCKRR